MSTFERMAKMKAERQKFYDTLLQKILALPLVQEYISDMKKETDSKTGKPFYEGYTEYDYEQSAIEGFFEGDAKDMLAVEEIWNMVKEEIREQAEWITSDAKTFLHDYDDLKAEDIMNDKLAEIQSELEDALKRRHGKT